LPTNDPARAGAIGTEEVTEILGGNRGLKVKKPRGKNKLTVLSGDRKLGYYLGLERVVGATTIT